jgi:hypothetical protein
MGLGIVEPRRQGTHVPATAVLLQDDLMGTKRKGKDDVVLVPRPSDSPRDPLVGTFHLVAFIQLASRLMLLTELAVVEERLLPFRYMPVNYSGWDSICDTVNGQWSSPARIPNFDYEG